MTSKDALRHNCRPGYWLVNEAPLGETPKWIEQVAPQPETNKLFGYDKDEFLAKQYRR